MERGASVCDCWVGARSGARVGLVAAIVARLVRRLIALALSHALRDYVDAVYTEMDADSLIWVSLAHNCYGHPLARQSMSGICQVRLGTTKVHATRHTFALGMMKSGAPVNAIQALFDRKPER